MPFIILLTRTHVICAEHKDVDVVLLSALLSALCKGYIIIHHLLYFACFYVNLLFILMYAPLGVGSSMPP
jgi:hypothetical protein